MTVTVVVVASVLQTCGLCCVLSVACLVTSRLLIVTRALLLWPSGKCCRSRSQKIVDRNI